MLVNADIRGKLGSSPLAEQKSWCTIKSLTLKQLPTASFFQLVSIKYKLLNFTFIGPVFNKENKKIKHIDKICNSTFALKKKLEIDCES